MTPRRWDVLIAAVLCTALGIASGYLAAVQAGGSTDGEPPAPEADPHLHFSPEAMRNMGIELGAVQPTTTAATRAIVGTLVDTPRTEQPVQAPYGGVVLAIAVDPGHVVRAGDIIARLVRDPIPAPTLQLTLEYAVPSHDEIHHAIRELREAHNDRLIASAELERVRAFTAEGDQAPLLPAQRRIDLEYQVDRATLRREVAEHELERHGFSAVQLAGLVAGEHVELFDADHTRRALEHGGLWSATADRVLKALPADVARVSFAVATVAELVGRGLADEPLCAWLEADPHAATHFVDVASLLLSGMSLAGVRHLAGLGGLEPEIAITAPPHATDWDVATLHAHPGDRVPAGATLVTLRDLRALRMRIEPVGSELEALRDVVARGAKTRALPLVPGAGPELDDLVIDYLATEGADPRPVAYARVANRPLVGAAETAFRSWQLERGTRYRVLVPTRELRDVYVLPRAAVATDGPDRIVFVPSGDGGFDEVPVVVVHEDDTTVVVEPGPRLPAGTQVVTRGAFELGLAMHAGDQAAGHDHDH